MGFRSLMALSSIIIYYSIIAASLPLETTGLPLTLPAKVVETTLGQRCPSPDQWEAARAEIYEDIISLLKQEYGTE